MRTRPLDPSRAGRPRCAAASAAAAVVVTAAVLAALGLGAQPAAALQTARPGRADARIKTLDYDPAQVVRLVGSFRTATEVAFGPDESITHIALGDSAAWDVAAETNLLFLKPKTRRGLTNLIVTTARGGETRTYTFELSTRAAEGPGRSASTYFQLRFRYPQDSRAKLQLALSAAETALERKIEAYKLDRGALEGPRNLAYFEQGDAELAPSEVSDNGRFTVLRFAGARPIPALYLVAPDGSESLVPFDVRGPFVVVHAVAKQLRLRRGRQVLCIWNDAYAPDGVDLGTRSAAPDVERVDTGGPS